MVGEDLVFTKKEAPELMHPYYDAFVLTRQFANNKIYQVLVDTGRSMDILFKGS